MQQWCGTWMTTVWYVIITPFRFNKHHNYSHETIDQTYNGNVRHGNLFFILDFNTIHCFDSDLHSIYWMRKLTIDSKYNLNIIDGWWPYKLFDLFYLNRIFTWIPIFKWIACNCMSIHQMIKFTINGTIHLITTLPYLPLIYNSVQKHPCFIQWNPIKGTELRDPRQEFMEQNTNEFIGNYWT